MERSLKASEYFILKATTSSLCDNVDFAIVHLTTAVLANLQQRLTNVHAFKNDSTFRNLVYWDSPLGYFGNPINTPFTATILNKYEDWTFVNLTEEELETFPVPKNSLEAHQLMISSHGYASFKAISKHTHEAYRTEWFSITDVLSAHKEKSINTS